LGSCWGNRQAARSSREYYGLETLKRATLCAPCWRCSPVGAWVALRGIQADDSLALSAPCQPAPVDLSPCHPVTLASLDSLNNGPGPLCCPDTPLRRATLSTEARRTRAGGGGAGLPRASHRPSDRDSRPPLDEFRQGGTGAQQHAEARLSAVSLPASHWRVPFACDARNRDPRQGVARPRRRHGSSAVAGSSRAVGRSIRSVLRTCVEPVDRLQCCLRTMRVLHPAAPL
jgi:hypothetical protein